MTTSRRSLFVLIALGMALQVPAPAQSPPNLTGVWGPFGAGRGTDSRLVPPTAGPLVLKPEFANAYEVKRAADAEAAKRGEPISTGSALCIPYGMPLMMAVATYPVEIIQNSAQITIIAEAFSEVRRIYLNQTQLPIDEVAPGYYGHSVGRWDGDTLTVDTVGIKETVRGYRGMPHSDKMRITERIKIVAPDVLHDQITIDDPLVLEKAVTYTLAYRRMADYKMVEFVCDNNREYVDDKGVIRMKLPRSKETR